MKKITLMFLFAIFSVFLYSSKAQILNQNASWPNAAWSVTGTYNAGATAFEADPTITSNFAFDDDDAGNPSDDDIAAESPIIDLTAAYTAGEMWLTVTADYVYRYLANDELVFQYWDADAASWNNWGASFDTLGNTTTLTDNFCSGTPTTFNSEILDITAFTATQQSGFRYRIYYNDDPAPETGDWNYGFCFSSPTITSTSCPAPSVVSVSNETDTTADLSWTENGLATAWNIEVVDITGGGTVTGTATDSGITNPYTLTGLVELNDYEFYLQSDCGGGDLSIWVGPFTFSTIASCLAPSSLAATNLTNDSAELSWTENGTTSLWNIELVDITAGGTVTGVATETGVTNPYDLTALLSNNDYEFYVQADCGNPSVSTWSGPFAFTTLCDSFIAPYTEDFETFTVSSSAFVDENCWTGTNLGGYLWEVAATTDTSSSATGPASGVSDGNYLFTEASSGVTGNTIDFISPLVDLSTLTEPSLAFDYHMFGVNMGTLEVIISDGATSTLEFSLTGEQQLEADAFKTAYIDLVAYVGQTIQVTFRGVRGAGYESDMAIDNVVFDELPSCVDPDDLSVDNETDATADLSWSDYGIVSTWNIEIVDVTAGGTATGVATVSGVTNPYTVTGLEQLNDYEFYVQADCSATWVGPFAFSTIASCLEPTALTATNITSSSADLGWTEGGTESLWNIEIVDITAGGTVTGVATYSGVSNPYTVASLVQLNDYEFYVQADCGIDGTSVWAGPFAFSTIASCPEPTLLTVTTITSVSADLGWTENGSSSNWDVEWGTIGFTPTGTPNVNDTSDNPYNLTGLTSATSYDFYVRSDCGMDDTDVSIWVGPITFQTQCNSTNVPFIEDFESSLTLGCGSAINEGSGNTWEVVNYNDYGFLNTNVLRYKWNTSNPADTWYFTQGINLTAGTSYTLVYDYGDTGTTFPESLNVAYGTAASAAAMTNALADHPNIGTVGPINNSVEITPATTGVYYFGFHAYSDADQFYLFVDNISVDVTLGVDEFQLDGFKYYPNPVNSTLTLNAQKNISNVSVFNMLGQEVIRTTPNNVSNEVDMSNLNSGAYFIKVTIDNVTETIKIIKN